MCATQFKATGGCQTIASGGDVTSSVPPGCSNCTNAVAALCRLGKGAESDDSAGPLLRIRATSSFLNLFDVASLPLPRLKHTPNFAHMNLAENSVGLVYEIQHGLQEHAQSVTTDSHADLLHADSRLVRGFVDNSERNREKYSLLNSVHYNEFKHLDFVVDIKNLIPRTEVNVFCAAELQNGFMVDLTTVKENKMTVITECCRLIIVTNSPSSVFADVQRYQNSPKSTYVFSYTFEGVPGTYTTQRFTKLGRVNNSS